MNLPPVGLGTMGIEEPTTIAEALDVGYRHLDTAQIYNNEDVVGAGLAASSVSREKITVATKVWADSLGSDDVVTTTHESCERLGVDRIDLLYVHRPIDTYEPATTLAAFDDLVDDGTVGAVGLSNFTVEQLQTARETLTSEIGAHQVEFHPLFWSDQLLADARTHDYPLVAYSPLAGGRVRENSVIGDIAAAHSTTPEAVSIAWLLSKQQVVTIPKASSREHLEANLAAAELSLTEAECRQIDEIEQTVELYPE